MTFKYDNGYLVQETSMKRPDGSTYRLVDDYRDDQREYDKHIASLLRYPVLEEHRKEFEGKAGLVKEKDFWAHPRTEFVAGNYMNRCHCCKEQFKFTDKLWFICQKCCAELVAIPIKPAAEDESQDKLWEEIGRQGFYEGRPGDLRRLIHFLRDNFTITRNPRQR